ncbi:PilZ domain-containing protein [Thermodesulfobacteriota bacterium]
MSSESNQKRRFDRVSISLPINGKCIMKLFQSHPFEGQSQNLSYDGLCIKANTNSFKVGQKVKLKTRLYKNDFSIKARGKICWVGSKNDSQGPINIGIKLTRTRHYSLWCKRVDEEFSII